MELIIHNRCSEMFSWIYDRAQRNSQVSLWCCFSPLSYKDKGLHWERMSAQPFSFPKIPSLSEIHHLRGQRLNRSQSLRNLGGRWLIYPNNTVWTVTWLIQQCCKHDVVVTNVLLFFRWSHIQYSVANYIIRVISEKENKLKNYHTVGWCNY